MDFDTLYTKFLFARKSVTEAVFRNGGSDNPFIRKEIKRFRAEIEIPMDAAWSAMSPDARTAWIIAEDARGA